MTEDYSEPSDKRPELDLEFLTLVLAAFSTAIVSGVIGMGGGILLLSVMGQFFPLATLVPLHALVQLGSNTSRSLLHLSQINVRITLLYSLGAVAGALAGSQVVVSLPEGPYKIALGLFILFLTFKPKGRADLKLPFKWFFVGGGATFLGLFVGATGPLIASFYLSERMNKRTLIATKAACQMSTHLLKLVAFFALGFTIGPHLTLIIAMVAAVFLGNYVGKLILHQVSEIWFYRIFRALILLLTCRMIWQGIQTFL